MPQTPSKRPVTDEEPWFTCTCTYDSRMHDHAQVHSNRSRHTVAVRGKDLLQIGTLTPQPTTLVTQR